MNQRPTNIRWLVFTIACLTSALLYIHRYSWGVIKPKIKVEFDLSDTQLGWLDSAFQVGYTIFQVPTGLAGDRWGPTAALPVMIFGWSLALAAIVLGNGFNSFAVIRFIFGATQAGAYPNLTKLTRSWFAPRGRTTVQGLVSVTSGRVGAACAPLLISTLLIGTLALNWQTTIYALSVAGVFLAVAARAIVRDAPGEHPRANLAERQLIGEEAPASPSTTRRSAPLTSDLAVWITLVFMMLQSFTSTFADALFVNWIPLFLKEAHGLSDKEMGIYASLPLIGGAIGGFAGGLLNDLLMRWTGKLRLARTAVGLTGKMVAAALVAVALLVEDGRQMMIVIAVAKFFTDWSLPTLWGAVTDVGGRVAGRVFGLVNMVGAAGGIVAGPVIGWTKQDFGWSAVFWLIVVVYILSALCWYGIDPNKRVAAA